MLSYDPLIEAEVLFASCLWAFSLPFYVRSAIPNRFYTYVKYIPYSMDRGIAKKSLTRPLLSTPPPHIPLRKTLCRSKLGT